MISLIRMRGGVYQQSANTEEEHMSYFIQNSRIAPTLSVHGLGRSEAG